VIDLHSHTTASDGLLSPSALLDAAAAAGLTVLAITDHDTTAGYLDAARVLPARALRLELVPGIEISAVHEGRDVHVLGYFLDPSFARLTDFLETQRTDRRRRVLEMADRLSSLGHPIDARPILDTASRGRSVGRPQIADALVAAGHVQSRDEAFQRFLQHGAPAFVSRRGASPREVVRLIHEAGGLASLAHPGVHPCDQLIEDLAAEGLDAVEACHSDHDAETEQRYRRTAARLALLVTGGSDFHGNATHRASALGAVTLPYDDYARLRDRAREVGGRVR
jgi:predicted metal-dependent phosphoesterase TrpH